MQRRPTSIASSRPDNIVCAACVRVPISLPMLISIFMQPKYCDGGEFEGFLSRRFIFNFRSEFGILGNCSIFETHATSEPSLLLYNNTTHRYLSHSFPPLLFSLVNSVSVIVWFRCCCRSFVSLMTKILRHSRFPNDISA